MSTDLILRASRRELNTLIEYTSYDLMFDEGLLIGAGDSLLEGFVQPGDMSRLYRVLSNADRTIDLSRVVPDADGLFTITIPSDLAFAFESLRHSLRTQGVRVRNVKKVGSLIQRMAAAVTLRGRVLEEF